MKYLLYSIFLFALCACSVTSENSFNDVTTTVLERTGKKVLWLKGDADEKLASEALDTLLSHELSMDDVVQIVLLNNPELQATYEELGIAEADLIQAGLLRNPVFSIERRFSGKALELDLTQDFIDLFFIPLRKKAAKASLEAAKFRVTQEVLDKASEAKIGFVELQAAKLLLATNTRATDAARVSLEARKKLRAAGNVPLLEVQNDANKLTEAELELAANEREVIEKTQHLHVLMGLWGPRSDGWKITSGIANLPPAEYRCNDLEEQALSERLDLKAAKEEFIAAADTLGLSRYAAMFTEATIGVHSEREPEGSTTLGPSLSIPIPIFDTGEAANARAMSLLRTSQRRYAALAIEIRAAVRASYAKMEIARKRAEFLRRDVLPLQTKILSQTNMLYNGMFIGVFGLLDAKVGQIGVERSYAESLKEFWISRAELERAIGNSLSIVKPNPASEETTRAANRGS